MCKISPNTSKYHSLSMVRIFFRLFERSNKIVTKSARKTLIDTIKSDHNWGIFVIEPLVESGFKNPNRNVRQICVEILCESIERVNDPKALRNVFSKCCAYINVSLSDSCDIVRATSKKIVQYLEKRHDTQIFQMENSEPSNNLASISLSSSKNTEAQVVHRVSIGKARRVKIER